MSAFKIVFSDLEIWLWRTWHFSGSLFACENLRLIALNSLLMILSTMYANPMLDHCEIGKFPVAVLAFSQVRWSLLNVLANTALRCSNRVGQMHLCMSRRHTGHFPLAIASVISGLIVPLSVNPFSPNSFLTYALSAPGCLIACWMKKWALLLLLANLSNHPVTFFLILWGLYRRPWKLFRALNLSSSGSKAALFVFALELWYLEVAHC